MRTEGISPLRRRMIEDMTARRVRKVTADESESLYPQRQGATSSRIAAHSFWRPNWHRHSLHRLRPRLLVNLCPAKYGE
jgi:hypothetical protein